jgi:hypothetical protein
MATATAATRGRLIAPANHVVLPRGVRPTFVLKLRPVDMATLEVSDSPAADAHGVFAQSVWGTGFAAPGGGKQIRLSPPRSLSRQAFWNRPGTYYWHVYRVDCPITGPSPHTCSERVITSTRSFTIAPRR